MHHFETKVLIPCLETHLSLKKVTQLLLLYSFTSTKPEGKQKKKVMEIEKMNCKVDREKEEEEEDVPLPGFRFHPTDEELVGFYLRRKVEKRPISIELIKQIDIYKYDPWDLPKGSNVGDKEWYFFCKRGRKYRNSIRPNRVTGSGFWKATGIDRPIYGEAGRRDCIGLKKSLVYYRGSAGKGTKTDWMMHEFRLPPPEDKTTKIKHNNIVDNNYAIPQEAEVWTLCRILKRSISSYKKGIPDWRELAAAKRTANTNVLVSAGDASSQTCSGDSSDHNTDIKQGYNLISFQNPEIRENDQKKPFLNHHHQQFLHHQQQQQGDIVINGSQVQLIGQNRHLQVCSTMSTTTTTHQLAPSTAASYSNYPTNLDINGDFTKHGDWDDLRSVVEFAVGTDPTYFMQ